MTLQELLIIGEPSPIFNFKKLSYFGDIYIQLNYIDSDMICIGIQADWTEKEKNDFRKAAFYFYFTEVDGILALIFEFGDIHGDVAFNPRNRHPMNTIDKIKEIKIFVIVLSIVDKNGNIVDIRITEMNKSVSRDLKESILRLERDNKLLDFQNFNKRVDELYKKYTVDNLKELSFMVHEIKKEL